MNPQFGHASDVQNAFAKGFTNEIYEDELTIWVDPLDGSKGFTEGHTHHLTCMIGVSIKNRPRLGIIHQPFSNQAFPGWGRSYIGLLESGLFR